jgi:hypothetical protein
MKRTTVVLPPDLEERAKRRARERGLTFGELVRIALRRELGEEGRPGARLPFLVELRRARRGGAPVADLSRNAETYLYGRKRRRKSS